jgi:hypothetical protein
VQRSLQRLGRAIAGLIAFVVIAPLVVELVLGTPPQPTDPRPGLAPWTPPEIGTDASVGLLVLALVLLWATQPRAAGSGAVPWRARKADPNPGSVNPVADLLAERPDLAVLPPPDLDPEAGGDHVARWRPEDAGQPEDDQGSSSA